MKKNFFSFSTTEKILLLSCGVGIFFALIGTAWLFFETHSEVTTAYGGTYSEGVVANANGMVFNPVYVYGKKDNSIEADIVSLIFSGLMKFNAKTGKIEDYLATHTLSADKKTYIFRLKDGLFWHDGEPMSANDIVFTYRDVISNPNFSNTSLQKAFESVEVKKISEKEVSFTLQYPYKFFLTNFTVGLLPRHILENTPVEELEYSDFSSTPVGNGLYSFSEKEEIRPNVFRITLSAFRKSSIGDPKIETFEFILYPSKNALSLDSQNLTGIRPFLQKIRDSLFIDESLTFKNFALPQYSALFFNLNNDVFKGDNGKKIRLALQLATDKKSLLDIVPGVQIDTPLLEITKNEWLYEYSPEKANGALKDAGYYFPSKKPKTLVPENSDAEFITLPTKKPEWIQNEGNLELSGIFPKNARSMKIIVLNKETEDLGAEITRYEYERKQILPKWKKEYEQEWKWTLSSETSFREKRQEIRVEFFDAQKKLLAQDALSLYWEKLSSPSKTENETTSPKEKEKTTSPEETEQGEETKNIDEEKKEQKEELKDGEKKENFDSQEKNATKEVEISLDALLENGEIRETMKGDPLKLTLLTADSPAFYQDVALYLQEDWKKIGVDLEIKVLPFQEFSDSVSHREYDILLYGQNLGYNLDIYEFFHGSQVGKDNLSEYTSQKASLLIREIRSSHVPEVRENKLKELRDVLKYDIPAVFLFSPTYQYYFSSQVKGMEVTYIAFLRDRFSNADEWYIEQEQTFKEGESWENFPEWFSQKFISFITFSL